MRPEPQPTGPAASEQGATLAELAVALLVSALIASAAYAAFAFATGSVSRWRRAEAQGSALYVLDRRLAEDIRRAARTVPLENGVLFLSATGDTTALYQMSGGVLTRSGVALPAEVPVSAIRADVRGDVVHLAVVLGTEPGSAAGGNPALSRSVSARMRNAPLTAWHPDLP